MSEVLKSAAVLMSCMSLAGAAGCTQEKVSDGDKEVCGHRSGSFSEYSANLWIDPCKKDDDRREVSCEGRRLKILAIYNNKPNEPIKKLRFECLNRSLSKDETLEESFQSFVIKQVKMNKKPNQ